MSFVTGPGWNLANTCTTQSPLTLNTTSFVLSLPLLSLFITLNIEAIATRYVRGRLFFAHVASCHASLMAIAAAAAACRLKLRSQAPSLSVSFTSITNVSPIDLQNSTISHLTHNIIPSTSSSCLAFVSTTHVYHQVP